MLLEEFLKPLGLRQTDVARRLGVSANRLNEVVLDKRRITADTAIRLSRLLKTSPQLWMRLQADWDLHRAARRAVSSHLPPDDRLVGRPQADRSNVNDIGPDVAKAVAEPR